MQRGKLVAREIFHHKATHPFPPPSSFSFLLLPHFLIFPSFCGATFFFRSESSPMAGGGEKALIERKSEC